MAVRNTAHRYLPRDEAANVDNLDQKPDQATTGDDSPVHRETGA